MQIGGSTSAAADGVTLSQTGNVLSIKDGGVGTTQLATDAVTGAKIAADGKPIRLLGIYNAAVTAAAWGAADLTLSFAAGDLAANDMLIVEYVSIPHQAAGTLAVKYEVSGAGITTCSEAPDGMRAGRLAIAPDISDSSKWATRWLWGVDGINTLDNITWSAMASVETDVNNFWVGAFNLKFYFKVDAGGTASIRMKVYAICSTATGV